MSKYYIEAFDKEGREILGNCEGQGVIHAKNYKRTNRYKSLSTFPTLNNRIAMYKITTERGETLEVIKNLTHPSNQTS